MTDNPIFDAVEHHVFAAARREWRSVEEHIRDVLHHDDEPRMAPHAEAALAARETPATMPATMTVATAAAPTEGTPVSLATIEDDLREDVTSGIEYVAGWVKRVQTAMPAIVSTVDTVSGSTVGKLAEKLVGVIIPEPYETILLNYAEDFAKRYGAAVPADPAQAPAQ